MKRLSDEELAQYLKRALEKPPRVEPPRSTEEMWRKIKEKEKRRKRIEQLRKIPMVASSFIAVVAVTFLFMRLPETSDQLTNQKEKQLAGIDRAYEEIQTATIFTKDEEEVSAPKEPTHEAVILKAYPTYLPSGFSLIKEEFLTGGHILTYTGDEKKIVVEMYYGEAMPQVAMRSQSVEQNRVQKKIENGTLLITGEVAEAELHKIIESMY